jgi:hypothetical protein
MAWSPRFLGNRRCDDGTGHPAWPFSDWEQVCAPQHMGQRTARADSIESKCWNMVHGFAMFNPHATVRIDWFGWRDEWPATNPAWAKWRPDYPTSSHWYEQRHIERLIAAYITHDRDTGGDRLVSDFLAEFDGLSGSIKRGKVLADADMKRVRLGELVVDSQLDSPRIAALLTAMQLHTRPVKAKRLGVIGADHFRERFKALGVLPESFQYARELSKD